MGLVWALATKAPHGATWTGLEWALGLSHSRCQRLVRQATRDGYVSKASAIGRGNKAVVTLSDSGWALYRQIEHLRVDREERVKELRSP